MSLLSGIQSKKKSLNKSTTTITTLSGEKILETDDGLGNKIQTKLATMNAGYVVDNQPDLQVAEILPYLSFGSQDVITDKDLLMSHGITHILSLGVQPPVEFSEFSYKFVDFLDIPEENLLRVLSVTNDLINTARRGVKSKVFVHCNAGCSRAPSVVIGYLMFDQRLSYVDAYNKVRSVRHVCPNEGFVGQLKELERALNIK